MRFVLLVCLAFMASRSFSQEFNYTVTNVQRAYVPFYDGTRLNSGIWSDPSYHFEAGFPLLIRDEYFEDLHITPEGTGGSIKFLNDQGAYTYMAFSIVDLMDRGRLNPPKSLSSIRYKTVGIVGERIFIIQYHNCGFANPITDLGDGSDFIHVQIHFHEQDGAIEVIYGERDLPNYNRIISDTQGNTIAFFKQFDGNYYQDSMFYLKNDPDFPEIDFIENGQVIDNLWQKEPDVNRAIRFQPKNSHTNAVHEFSNFFLLTQHNDRLRISSNSIKNSNLRLFNIQGQLVSSIQMTSGHAEISTASLSSGIYLIESHSGQIRTTKNIYISREY